MLCNRPCVQSIATSVFHAYDKWECAKFRGSRAIGGLVGLVPSCNRAFVGISWDQNIFLVGTRWSETFSRGYFVGQNFFLKSILWAQFFPYRWFRDSNILGCWLHEQEWQKQKYKNTSQTTYSFYIRKVLYLLNYIRYYAVLICSNCIFRHLFSSVLGSFHS